MVRLGCVCVCSRMFVCGCAYSAICSSNVNVIETQQVSTLLSLLPFKFYHESRKKTDSYIDRPPTFFHHSCDVLYVLVTILDVILPVMSLAVSLFKNTSVVCILVILYHNQ